MHVAKLCAANDNGLVPAGQYFRRLADALGAANQCAAALADAREVQERKLETRFRRTAKPALGKTRKPKAARQNAPAQPPTTMN